MGNSLPKPEEEESSNDSSFTLALKQKWDEVFNKDNANDNKKNSTDKETETDNETHSKSKVDEEKQEEVNGPKVIDATDDDFHNAYMMRHLAGDGTSAVVHFATDIRNGRKVAVKVIRKNVLDKESAGRISNELKAWRTVDHPNICKLLEVFNTPTTYYFACEAADNGDLLEFINNRGFFKEKQARRIFDQLLSAVDHCHKLGVVHRDLKLENILLDKEGNVKLTDFGFAGFFDITSDNRLHEWCGSPPYAAPEIFLGRPYIGPEVDVWSLGVVLYALCTGALPFNGDTFDLLMRNVVQAKFDVPFFISMSCESLIRSMLERNPDNRIKISQIHCHSWLHAPEFGKTPISKFPTNPSDIVASAGQQSEGREGTEESSPPGTPETEPKRKLFDDVAPTPPKPSTTVSESAASNQHPAQVSPKPNGVDKLNNEPSTSASKPCKSQTASATLMASKLMLFDCPNCNAPQSARWNFETRKPSVCDACATSAAEYSDL